MARKIEPKKAKDEIQRYFNHLELEDKLNAINQLVKSMIEPESEEENEKIEKIKKELKLYKDNGGSALKAFVNEIMYPDKKK